MSGIVSPQFFEEEPCSVEVLEKVIGELKESTVKLNKEIEECQKLRKNWKGE